MQLIDTHAHLDFTDDVEGWCQRAKTEGVNKIICVGTSVEASKKCVSIAEQRRTGTQIYATVGIHAEDGKGDVRKYGSLDKCINTLKQIASTSEKVVAVGECGFDFKLGDKQSLRSSSLDKPLGHELGAEWLGTAGLRVKSLELSDEEKKFQRELFEVQIELATKLQLPLLIHCRNAWSETFELLKRFQGSKKSSRKHPETSSGNHLEDFSQGSTLNLTGVFHSWTGDWEAAKKALSLGFYISFSGIATFKNAPRVQEVATKMPLARMMLETDSPFLAPHPLRGSPNEPKNVRIIAEFIAQLRNFPVDELANVTSGNARRLFRI